MCLRTVAHRTVTSAGEVEQFAYCAHNWLLARAGVDSHAGASGRGMAGHREKGRAQVAVEADKRQYRVALLAALAVMMLGGAGLLASFALTIRGSTAQVTALTVSTISLGLGAAALLTLALFAQRAYRHNARAAKLVPGRLLASDLAGEAPLLEDPSWGLSGRPDYILQTRDGPVPVEVKTGRTPPKPHRSHVLQAACYLRLLAATGRPAPYALLTYPDGVFRVDATPETIGDLEATLARLREAERTGVAHRDHEHPSRCRGCARRSACDERLA